MEDSKKPPMTRDDLDRLYAKMYYQTGKSHINKPRVKPTYQGNYMNHPMTRKDVDKLEQERFTSKRPGPPNFHGRNF